MSEKVPEWNAGEEEDDEEEAEAEEHMEEERENDIDEDDDVEADDDEEEGEVPETEEQRARIDPDELVQETLKREKEKLEDEEEEVDQEEDDDMEENPTQEEVASGEEEQAKEIEHKADTASEQVQQHSQPELVYSTRNRTVEPTEPIERHASSEMGEVLLHEPAAVVTTTPRESFLSDSLTEEERRTRTRYLPQVTGMHALRKHEVKGDLALARSILTATGVATTLTKSKRSNNSKRSEDNLNAADADGTIDAAASVAGTSGEENVGSGSVPHSEDERMPDALRTGGKMIEIGSVGVLLPSPAFVAPSMETTVGESKDGKGAVAPKHSPREVEAIAAFNPPRPPESIGAKKKHRMLRWERRPADIEVDLNNYRKTVQRTQQELRNAQLERDRIESVDNILRSHFVHHIQNMNDEITVLNRELAVAQQDCIDAADLLTARTRNRGGGKGSHAMRDVLHALRTRGEELKAKGHTFQSAGSTQITCVKGAGGVAALSFEDWDYSTVIKPQKIADAWIVPGDKVLSPYGEGIVVAVHPSDPLTENNPPPEAPTLNVAVADAMELDSPVTSGGVKSKETGSDPKKKRKLSDGAGKEEGTEKSLKAVRSPRVAVQLPYGIAYFPLQTLKSNEDPASYSDERLAGRWKGLFETAKAMASVSDIEAMVSVVDHDMLKPSDSQMDIEESETHDVISTKGNVRLLPFGSEMLPSAFGRGNLLLSSDIEDLDKAMEKPLYGAGGNAGIRGNRSVPQQVRALEELREERLTLQAKVLQLKNKLFRQRRIRMLNERTHSATLERANRIESLVAEMRADLDSLKSRLDEELQEIGVNSEQMESILSAYYKSLESQHSGEASPPKRQRRQSDMNSEDDEGVDEGALDDHETGDGIKQ